MFLLIVDAHSRWLEIHSTNSSTSTATIKLMRKTFAGLGLPEVVVSDNASAFTSPEFSEFLRKNGIRHVRTPPYHPASNGLVECTVQTFKEGLKRLSSGSLNTRLSRFLFHYHLMPHSATGVSPAEIMFGRKLRSQLKPSEGRKARQSQEQQKRGHDAHAIPRSFRDFVYARNYGPGPKWLPGQVEESEGSVMFQLQLADGRVIHRHADQLRSRARIQDEGPRAEESVSEDVTITQEKPGDELRDAQIVETAESHPSGSNNTSNPDITEEPVVPVHEEMNSTKVQNPRHKMQVALLAEPKTPLWSRACL